MLQSISNHKGEVLFILDFESSGQWLKSVRESSMLGICFLFPFGAFQPLHEIFHLHHLG